MNGHRGLLALVLVLALPAIAAAQVRGFVDAGITRFTASESFAAILGSSGGPVFGGGVEVTLPKGVFATVRASRFSKAGKRVFLFEGERFELDVDTTISVTPLEFSAGWRLRPVSGLTPYVAGGLGLHRYRETSEAATGAEDVDERFTGYHVLGGAEFRIMQWLSAAGEAQWTAIPGALGSDPNGVAAAFGESDLGGTSVRIKVIIGR